MVCGDPGSAARGVGVEGWVVACMASRVEELSVAVPHETAAWARKDARRLKKSLSAVVTEALEQRRRGRAWARFRDDALGGKPPTPQELEAARRELAWKD